MFVAAFDDRVLAPGYFIPFIQNTTRFCDLHFISPAKIPGKSSIANSAFKFYQFAPCSLPEYQNVRKLFDASFVNYSTNSFSFERACFHRWFALNAATSTLSDNTFICLLDTDFLIGMSPSTILSLCMSQVGHENLEFIAEWSGADPVAIGPEITIMTKSFLFDFCKYLITTYYSPDMKSQLLGDYFDRIGNGLPGGICDMRALAAYSMYHPQRIFNLRQLHKSQIIDNFNSFLVDEVGQIENWKISFSSGIQTLYLHDEPKSLIGIHFQGTAKIFINLACIENNDITSKVCADYPTGIRTYANKVAIKIKRHLNDLIKLFFK